MSLYLYINQKIKIKKHLETITDCIIKKLKIEYNNKFIKNLNDLFFDIQCQWTKIKNKIDLFYQRN